ncbi:MAG: hypothetical protein COB66_07740 [Coxiella sp. (in: Bacteria)]|nr:MAG: hypothetical protein COB66_07740 [Coxiella sp. (in: g-proteobacteria)]
MPILNHVKEFNNNGFVIVNDVFTNKEVLEIMGALKCNDVENHFNKNPDGFGFHLLEITTMHDIFLKYACHPKIMALITPILGNDIQLQHSKLSVKMPGERKGEIPWHQDFAFLPHTNTSLLAVMICLVDFTQENGCMKMVMGSHTMGILNYRDKNGFESACSDSWAWEDKSKISEVTPRKGGISIHHCMTLHSSNDNITEIPRYSLAFQYRARNAYQFSDKVWKDTGLVVSGNASGPLDIRLDEMSIPLLKNSRYPGFPFGSAFNQIGTAVKDNKLVSPFRPKQYDE